MIRAYDMVMHGSVRFKNLIHAAAGGVDTERGLQVRVVDDKELKQLNVVFIQMNCVGDLSDEVYGEDGRKSVELMVLMKIKFLSLLVQTGH